MTLAVNKVVKQPIEQASAYAGEYCNSRVFESLLHHTHELRRTALESLDLYTIEIANALLAHSRWFANLVAGTEYLYHFTYDISIQDFNFLIFKLPYATWEQDQHHIIF